MNAFIAAFLVVLSFLVIKEIRKSLIKSTLFIAIGIFSVWLGINKINRDNAKDVINGQYRHDTDSTLKSISESYKKDTSRFSDFKKQLDTDFHIKDSANKPIQIQNYKPVFNTHINKAGEVKIG